jgi:CRISPR/Cas system CSM-associated protein Csm2 small subunit
VRYLNLDENSEFVEIELKKKDQEAHLLRKVSVVPYIVTKNGPKYLCSSNYKSFKYYEFAHTQLAYTDIPTIKNKDGEDIIDISAFYKDFKDFIFKMADSAIKRVMEGELEGKIKQFTLVNHLKAKVYEPFYNAEANTLAILVKCEADENLKIKQYEFQSIMGNTFGELIDETLKDKINQLVSSSKEVTSKFLENPLNITKNDVQKNFDNHQDIARREKAVFYKEMIESAIPTAKGLYAKSIDRVTDKELLECPSEMTIMLAIERSQDVRNCTDKLFHVYP